MARRFVPSTESVGYLAYGAEETEVVEEQEEKSSDYSTYIPYIKQLLGVDDPRLTLPILRTRLAILKKGGAGALTEAQKVCFPCGPPTAITIVEARVEELERQAAQVATRDFLFTGMMIGGMALIGLSAVYLGAKINAQLKANKAMTSGSSS